MDAELENGASVGLKTHDMPEGNAETPGFKQNTPVSESARHGTETQQYRGTTPFRHRAELADLFHRWSWCSVLILSFGITVLNRFQPPGCKMAVMRAMLNSNSKSDMAERSGAAMVMARACCSMAKSTKNHGRSSPRTLDKTGDISADQLEALVG